MTGERNCVVKIKWRPLSFKQITNLYAEAILSINFISEDELGKGWEMSTTALPRFLTVTENSEGLISG